MTVLPWPTDLFARRPKPTRKLIIDPLPQTVLHQLVADLPGPRDETGAERAARFQTQLAEVLHYNPRDSADAMIAAQCVMLRLLAEDCHRDAEHQRHEPAKAKKIQRTAKQFDKLLAEMEQTLAHRQAQPAPKLDPAMFAVQGLEEFLIPDPDDDFEEEAHSAIIVPLHPAPKLLQ